MYLKAPKDVTRAARPSLSKHKQQNKKNLSVKHSNKREAIKNKRLYMMLLQVHFIVMKYYSFPCKIASEELSYV